MPQTILIIGASTGIGKAIAELFFERGWNLVAATIRVALLAVNRGSSRSRIRKSSSDYIAPKRPDPTRSTRVIDYSQVHQYRYFR
ncbi:MAG: hypothetical protein ACREWG_08805 [Gammaproteobacteria bacterium]